MEIVKNVFDKALVLKLRTRMDNRGLMTVNYEDEFVEGKIGFKTKESRVYTIPKKGTFFGIHYREEKDPMGKLVTVIHGRAMDYIVDLRQDSPTYLKWEKVELSAENAVSVYITAGNNAYSKTVSYRDEKIGLKLELPITEISDYDIDAPLVSG